MHGKPCIHAGTNYVNTTNSNGINSTVNKPLLDLADFMVRSVTPTRLEISGKGRNLDNHLNVIDIYSKEFIAPCHAKYELRMVSPELRKINSPLTSILPGSLRGSVGRDLIELRSSSNDIYMGR